MITNKNKHFVHDPVIPGETIAAIATPTGEGGIAVVRISGTGAVAVADAIFSGNVPSFASHTVHWGRIQDSEGKIIDEALAIPMLGSRSFTGEDTVEIQCHGGSLVAKLVLQAALTAGARAAKPGEFSERAFLNGKLDLAQAEAIQELISAKNEHALGAAREQLAGSLSKKILKIQENLIDIAAMLEAWVDFPEEGLEFAHVDEIASRVMEEEKNIAKLLATFENGRIAREGVALCLIGSPNVGKSSLMNAMLDKDRAIVSPIPGTTRDILEDHLRLNGMNFRLTDTAGIRETTDLIELEGVRRSKQAMGEADLILYLLDLGRKPSQEELQLLEKLPANKTVVVWNKADEFPLQRLNYPHECAISAKTKEGFESLIATIDQVIWKAGPPSFDEVLITTLRHKETLEEALSALQRVREGLREGASPEFISFDMRSALKGLGKIIGFDITEDILSSVFSQFCVGK